MNDSQKREEQKKILEEISELNKKIPLNIPNNSKKLSKNK